VTLSSEVSRAEPISAMVTRSRAREGRGISVVPEIEYWKQKLDRNRKFRFPCQQSVRKVWEPA